MKHSHESMIAHATNEKGALARSWKAALVKKRALIKKQPEWWAPKMQWWNCCMTRVLVPKKESSRISSGLGSLIQKRSGNPVRPYLNKVSGAAATSAAPCQRRATTAINTSQDNQEWCWESQSCSSSPWPCMSAGRPKDAVVVEAVGGLDGLRRPFPLPPPASS